MRDLSRAQKILIVDDEKPIRQMLSASLIDEGFSVRCAAEGEAALRELKDHCPHVVFLDIWMPGNLDGMAVLDVAIKQFPQVHFVMMSGHGTIETAVRAVRLGAWDFVEKPLSIEKVLILIENIRQFREAQQDRQTLINRLRKSFALIGESPRIQSLKSRISSVSPLASWVLINGESGVGKELVAQNIHYLSVRASKPFVQFHCGTMPEELMAVELFGCEKGVFSGIEREKKGQFDLAGEGTIFLEEIGAMGLDSQRKLLEVLRSSAFFRVGGTTPIANNARIVASNSQDLRIATARGLFLEDLYHRLTEIQIDVPPLRHRVEDIGLLLEHFGDYFCREIGMKKKTFTEAAYSLLREYNWPGNVRELRNFVERIFILTPTDHVDVHDLRFAGLEDNTQKDHGDSQIGFKEARARFEREFILKKIEDHQGNISKTAESIGLERSYLHRKIKGFGMDI